MMKEQFHLIEWPEEVEVDPENKKIKLAVSFSFKHKQLNEGGMK